MFRYSLFATPLGHMGVVASPKGLHMVVLPRRTENEVKMELEGHYTEELVRDEKGLSGIRQKLLNYLAGKKIIFNVNLDAAHATPFEIKVWDTVNGIPYGQSRSYDWVAKQVGAPNKVRAVGQALKHNRLPLVIPCHRVIKKSGDLGGFSAGVELKRKLLKIEGRLL
jgi:methylated-DNA-[protein]-cysteine S-methyltransferase